MKMLRSGVSLVFYVALTACTFSTRDISRPLVVEGIPKRVDTIAEASKLTGIPEADLEKSFAMTRSARNFFDIHKYNESYTHMDLTKLANAIALAPGKNPFAWTQLGAYLSLLQDPIAAAEAAEHGRKILREICAKDPCPSDFRNLYPVVVINESMSLAQTDDGADQAVQLLNDIEVGKLTGFQRLAYYWTKAQAHLAGGDGDGAKRSLEQASKVKDIEQKYSYDYPQYFGDLRKGLQLYLEGRVSLAEGQYTLAEEQLRAALQRDPELWEAYFALANVQSAQRKNNEAILTLRTPVPKSMMARSERIKFNLGNVYLLKYDESGDVNDLHSARSYYKEAIEDYQERGRQAQRQYREVYRRVTDPELSRFFFTIADRFPPVYADAWNNLGEVEFWFADEEPNEEKRRRQFLVAERDWRRALLDFGWADRKLAHANLARLYSVLARPADAVEEAEAAADSEELFTTEPVETLIQTAELLEDLTNAARVAYVAADIVLVNRMMYVNAQITEWAVRIKARFADEVKTSEVQRALIAAELLADDQSGREKLAALVREHSEWDWVGLFAARQALKDKKLSAADIERLTALAGQIAARKDWMAKRDLANISLILADLRKQIDATEARRHLETAAIRSIEKEQLKVLGAQIEHQLRRANKPLVTSLVVLFMPTITNDLPVSNALAESFAVCFRETGLSVRQVITGLTGVRKIVSSRPQEIARMLRGGAILSGRISTETSRVHIQASLVDAVTGEMLWSGYYSGDPTEIVTLQQQMLDATSKTLGLGDVVAGSVKKNFTADAAAYKSYLLGQQLLLTKVKEKDMTAAIAHFEEAIARDDKFARAYAALSLAHYQRSNLYFAPREEMPKAKAAAEKALSLAPDLAEAHLARALVLAWYDWDFPAAQAEFELALKSDPDNAFHHRMYASFLLARGDFAKANEEQRLALDLAPISPRSLNRVGWGLFYLGRRTEAAVIASRALELEHDLVSAHELKAWILTADGKYQEALKETHEAIAASKETAGDDAPAYLVAHLGVVYALLGNLSETENILARLDQRKDATYSLPLLKARIYAALGNAPMALRELTTAYQYRSESLVGAAVDPWLAKLRQEPEFQKLVTQVDAASTPVR